MNPEKTITVKRSLIVEMLNMTASLHQIADKRGAAYEKLAYQIGDLLSDEDDEAGKDFLDEVYAVADEDLEELAFMDAFFQSVGKELGLKKNKKRSKK